MRAVDIIRAKRDGGGELTADQIAAFVEAAARGTWPDYQLSALLMAIWLRGMSPAETAALTKLMADSGRRLDLSDIPGAKVDKHSTGGVGDCTSLVLGPLAAACGVVVPMMSGRGLGHTGGTLDKLEAIPGFRTNLTETEFRDALRTVGIGMIGQSADVAPADRKLYALRDVTATVESVPLITASILSKKLAEGIGGLVLDVKVGRGAFMKTPAAARELADSLVTVARANGLRCEALLTAMDAPLARNAGNASEVRECISLLKGERSADRLTVLSVKLAARMVRLAGRAADLESAEKAVWAALASGDGLAVFRKMVEVQGGDPRVVDDPGLLPTAPHEATVRPPRAGYVTSIDAEKVGAAAMLLGAGRRRAEDAVDPGVGVRLAAGVNTKVQPTDAVFVLTYRSADTLREAVPLLETAFTVGDGPEHPMPLILEALE